MASNKLRAKRATITPCQQQRTLYVTAGRTPINLVLADVATREDHDLVRSHQLVEEGIWKAMQEGATHLAIVRHRCVHLRVQPEELKGGIEFRDKGTPEAPDLGIVPRAGVANLRTRLWSKRNMRHG